MKLVTISTAPGINLKTLTHSETDRSRFDTYMSTAIASIKTYIVLGDTYSKARGKEFKLGLPAPEPGKEGLVHRVCPFLDVANTMVKASGQHILLHEFSLSNLDTGAMAVRVMGCQSKHRAALQSIFKAEHSEGIYKARYYV